MAAPAVDGHGGRGRAQLPRLLHLLQEEARPDGFALAEEKQRLDDFLLQNGQRYSFPAPEHASLCRLLVSRRLLLHRLQQPAQASDHRLRVLQSLRVLLRDGAHRDAFVELGGLEALSETLSAASREHFGAPARAEPLGSAGGSYASEILVELLSIAKRFADSDALLAKGEPVTRALHESLALLLRSHDALVLQCVLVALAQLLRAREHRESFAALSVAEPLLRILADYEVGFKVLVAECLGLLVGEPSFAAEIGCASGGLPVLLSLLHVDDARLPLALLGALDTLAESADCLRELRHLGGLHVVLALLGPAAQRASRAHPAAAARDAPPSGTGESASAEAEAEAGGAHADVQHAQQLGAPREHTLSAGYVVAVCSLLARLAVDNENAHSLRKSNAVYLLGLLLLPTPAAGGVCGGAGKAGVAHGAGGAARASAGGGGDTAGAAGGDADAGVAVRAAALRALRCLFSTERNRRLFKRLFPPALFAAFIDIGHYVHDLDPYERLIRSAIAPMQIEARQRMAEALADVNVARGPARRVVRGYALHELLGRGAFGRVYHARREGGGGGDFALKELFDLEAGGGGGADGNGAGAGAGGEAGGADGGADAAAAVRREVLILAGLSHPNIIQYYDSFCEGGRMYIVTELVDGASLLDHLTALREKGERLPEERVWQLFVQLLLALRYCHKAAGVVHRDLTPANILLTADGTLKLADFGLAKRRESDSALLESVVGTVIYQPPEIIKHEPYSDKADIWSLGCILYETAMLEAPFAGSNPLVVASRIVEGSYPPLGGQFSPMLHDVVARCLAVRQELRPDADGVSRLIAPRLLAEIDAASVERAALSAELAAERERRAAAEREAARSKESMHRLFSRSHSAAPSPSSPFCATFPANGSGHAHSFAGPLHGAAAHDPAAAGASLLLRPPLEMAAVPLSGGASPAIIRPQRPALEGGGAGRGRGRGVGGGGGAAGADAAARARGKGERGGGDIIIGSGSEGDSSDWAARSDSALHLRAANGSALHRLLRCSSADATAELPTVSPLRRVASGGPSHPSGAVGGRSGLLSISPHRVREISDPASLLLNQLHKVLFIDQLPPSLSQNHERAIVERYKRFLFAARHGTRARPLKDELHRLLSGSKDMVDVASAAAPLHTAAAAIPPGPGSDLIVPPAGSGAGAGANGGASGGGSDGHASRVGCAGPRSLLPSLGSDTPAHAAPLQLGVSYERLQQMIENVLAETGYYDHLLGPEQPGGSAKLGERFCPSSPSEGDCSPCLSSSAPDPTIPTSARLGTAAPVAGSSASPRLSGPPPLTRLSSLCSASSSLAANPASRRISRLPRPG